MTVIDADTDQARAYKEKIVGKTSLKRAPSRYWQIGIIVEMNVPMITWEQYTMEQKAEIMARHYIKNMIAVVDAHYDEQDRALENLKKNKKSG